MEGTGGLCVAFCESIKESLFYETVGISCPIKIRADANNYRDSSVKTARSFLILISHCWKE